MTVPPPPIGHLPPLRLSVVIPVHGEGRWLPQAVASVIGATGVAALQVVLVDDASPTEGAEVVDRLATTCPVVEVVRLTSNVGVAAARNVGLAACRHPLVGFLDHDDEWTHGGVSSLHQALVEAPAALAAQGLVEYFLEDGVEPPRWLRARWLEAPTIAGMLANTLFRREAFDTVGGFDPELRHGTDDVDWWARAIEVGLPLVRVSDVVLRHRVHDSNLSASTEGANAELLRVIRAKVTRAPGLEART